MAKSVNPPEYRTELCTRILRHVLRGESCTVLGVGSSGKSNVARQLAWAEARAHCLRGQTPDAAGVLGVLVDFLNDTSGDAPGFYRLFLEALMKATTAEDALPRMVPLRADLTQLWERSTETSSPDRVRVFLQDAIARCFKGGITHLFFVLDDFDKQLITTAPAILNSLRALRDDHKGRLAYVVMLRREAAFVLSDAGKERRDYEDLLDLIAKQVFAVGRFEGPDIDIFVRRLLVQGSRNLGPAELQRLVAWAGGHAGLMKTIYGAVEKGNLDLLSPNGLAQAQQRADVRSDCQIIWDSLDKQEHAALLSLAQGAASAAGAAGATTTHAGTFKRLENKGLATSSVNLATGTPSYDFTSPLFAYFVGRRVAVANTPNQTAAGSTNAAADGNPGTNSSAGMSAGTNAGTNADTKPIVLMDGVSRIVRVDGRDVRLEPREYIVFVELYEKRNTDLTLPTLLGLLQQHPGPPKYGGPPDQRVQRYMTDVMNKINTPARTYITQTETGSYRFQE